MAYISAVLRFKECDLKVGVKVDTITKWQVIRNFRKATAVPASFTNGLSCVLTVAVGEGWVVLEWA